jgi:hypothetical protein
MELPDDEAELAPGAVRQLVREAQNAIGRETRKLNRTGGAKRTGKHGKLDPSAKAERDAARRARKVKREEEKETLAEAVKIRRARRQAEEEEEAARRRFRIRIPKEREPKVTAGGGRKYARSYQRFERQVLPFLPAHTPSGSSTLVLRIKSRRLGGFGPSRWRKHELANFFRYLTRGSSLAAEPEAAVLTNISQHRPGTDEFIRELAAFGQAIEELEGTIDPNGQVYHSGVIPLPWELGPEAHCRIARTVQETYARRGLPCLVVLHAPDPGSDTRNAHLHIVVVARVFTRHAERDWSFAPTRSRDVFHPAMVKVWRRFLVGLFNQELARTASKRRYTLELADTPGEHLGRARTVEARRRIQAAEVKHVAALSEEKCSRSVVALASALVEAARQLRAAGRKMAWVGLVEQKAGLEGQASRLASLVERSIAANRATRIAATRGRLETLRTGLQGNGKRVDKAAKALTAQTKVAQVARLQRAFRAYGDRLDDLYTRTRDATRRGTVKALTSDREALKASRSRTSIATTRLGAMRTRTDRDRQLRELRVRSIPGRNKLAAAGERLEHLTTYVRRQPVLTNWRETFASQQSRMRGLAARIAGIPAQALKIHPAACRAARADNDIERGGMEIAEAPDLAESVRAFDKAVTAIASPFSAEFEEMLASVRRLLLERRLVIRRVGDKVELATNDEAASAIAVDAARRRFGRMVLTDLAGGGEAPAGWRRTTFRALAVTQQHNGQSVRGAREAALRRSWSDVRASRAHHLIHQATGTGLITSASAAALQGAVTSDRALFSTGLKVEGQTGKLMFAAADRHVLSILTSLSQSPDGRRLLIDLAKKDALGNYPAQGDWSQWMVELAVRPKAREDVERNLHQPRDEAPAGPLGIDRIPKSVEPQDQARTSGSSVNPDLPEDISLEVLRAAQQGRTGKTV